MLECTHLPLNIRNFFLLKILDNLSYFGSEYGLVTSTTLKKKSSSVPDLRGLGRDAFTTLSYFFMELFSPKFHGKCMIGS